MEGPSIFDETQKATSKKITIDPVTRLEGHAKIEIFLNDAGNVEDAFLQVVELRGFERFLQGRPVEELPRIVTAICGVCSSAHHLAAAKANDAVFNAEPTETAKKIRELYYCGQYVHSHLAHFYVLAAPDFVLGPAANPSERNIVGLIQKVGVEIGKEVIKHRGYGQKIQEILGGKAVHAVAGLPGGWSKAVSKEEGEEILTMFKSCVGFSEFSLDLFSNLVLKNNDYIDLISGDVYKLTTHNMGLVDDKNKVNFCDGKVRVGDTMGNELAKFESSDYLNHIGEHVEPWSYLKFPFLKSIGWKGLVDGQHSGIYRVGPLGRLNAADGMATPLAQEHFDEMYEMLGVNPIHSTLAMHWARLIELLYASERGVQLAEDEEITSKDIRSELGEPSEGIGIVEAPRGTLIHHYKTDEKGILDKANIIVATTHNKGPICMSIKKVAQNLIKDWQVSNGLLNMVEMAFRAYDPCFACATHTLPGQMPLEVRILDKDRTLRKRLSRNL